VSFRLAARFVVLALAVTSISLSPACGFSASGPGGNGADDGSDGSDDGDDDDGGIGGRPDAAPLPPDAEPDVCLSWSPGIEFLDPCAIQIADRGGPLILDQAGGNYVYNTSNATLTDPTSGVVTHSTQVLANGVRLVSAERIEIAAGATLRVIGDSPLLMISWDDIDLDGRVEVHSPRGGSAGAGANPDSCESDNAAGGPGGAGDAGSGGGGGGFAGAGGPGGPGEGGDGTEGAGGIAAITANLLRGGCPGGTGGEVGSNPAAAGGSGGGAFGFSAYDQLDVNGVIHAGGGGGSPGGPVSEDGGGGGGSGGMIWLDAVRGSLGSNAVLAANGGGGGEGSDGSDPPSNPGGDGQDSVNVAIGGTAGGTGGDGGNGSTDVDLGGSPGVERDDVGGGGGGGGAGVIIIDPDLEVDPGAVISPQPD
jgi:hypothetical protein